MALVVALSSGIATKKKWEVFLKNNVWEKANFTKCLLCMRHGSELDPYTTVVSCWAEPWNVKGSPVPQRRQKVSELGSSGLSRLSRHSQKKLKKHRKKNLHKICSSKMFKDSQIWDVIETKKSVPFFDKKLKLMAVKLFKRLLGARLSVKLSRDCLNARSCVQLRLVWSDLKQFASDLSDLR